MKNGTLNYCVINRINLDCASINTDTSQMRVLFVSALGVFVLVCVIVGRRHGLEGAMNVKAYFLLLNRFSWEILNPIMCFLSVMRL